MSLLGLFVSGFLSFIGSVIGLCIFPYLKECFNGGEELLRELSDRLSVIEEIKDKSDSALRKYYNPDDCFEWSDAEINLFRANYIALKNEVFLIIKSKYKLELSLYGNYEKCVKSFLKKLLENNNNNESDFDYMIKDFIEGGFDPDVEVEHYTSYIQEQGLLAVITKEEIYTIKEGLWFKVCAKKTGTIFHRPAIVKNFLKRCLINSMEKILGYLKKQ
ncbi:hypothetical protein [Zymobacter sp. IVIA_12111.31 C1]|uniref:hypothetical protein n=1 Tax=Zymobacter sp. IVIA_12111.31 C1 TaxID=3394854 RepID=UPI0039C472B9